MSGKNVWVDGKRFLRPYKKVRVPWKRCGCLAKGVGALKKVWAARKNCVVPGKRVVCQTWCGSFQKRCGAPEEKGVGRRGERCGHRRIKLRASEEKGAGVRGERCGAPEEKVRGAGGKGAGHRRKRCGAPEEKVRGTGGKGAGHRRKRCGAPEEKCAPTCCIILQLTMDACK